jgi:tetratricopeptide (TPR) repeat protein
MASNYLAMRNLDSARIALAEALRRPARLSDAQRYRLLADGDYMLRYDIPGAIRWYDLLLQIAPRSLAGHNNRAALLHSLGRYQEALAGFRRTEELEPFGTPQAQIEIFNQVVTLLAMGRDAEAATTAQKLTGLYSEYAAELLATYRGEWGRAESLASEMTRNPTTPAWLKTPATSVIAGARAARGAVSEADAQLRAAAAAAQGAARVWFSNAVLLLAASRGQNPGPPPRWILADTSAGGLLAAGVWSAQAGDVRLARRRHEMLQRKRAIEQRRLGIGPALLQGSILAAENRWSDAAARLRAAALTGELDGGDLNQVSSMAVRLLMARAYERTGSPDSAAMMYRMILNPARTPFTHLALRGLAYPFASRRLAQLGRSSTIAGP